MLGHLRELVVQGLVEWCVLTCMHVCCHNVIFLLFYLKNLKDALFYITVHTTWGWNHNFEAVSPVLMAFIFLSPIVINSTAQDLSPHWLRIEIAIWQLWSVKGGIRLLETSKLMGGLIRLSSANLRNWSLEFGISMKIPCSYLKNSFDPQIWVKILLC